MNKHGPKLSLKVSATGWLTIFIQLALPVGSAFTPASANLPGNPQITSVNAGNDASVASSHESTERHIASSAQIAGGLLSQSGSSDAAINMARSNAVGAVNNAANSFFSQFGTAKIQLSLDDEFNVEGSAFDLLHPLYENQDSLYFTQLGVRHLDGRTTSNIGLGLRKFTPTWMYGFNTFFDNDMTGKNRRLGIGSEAALDFLKLSANGYVRLTDWHQSRDFEDYDERPANGFDLRTNAWLPSYSQLGAQLMYEYYQGNQVALFNKNSRQKNPYAVTAGVNYTPIPLMTFGVNHKQGKQGEKQTSLDMQLTYKFGESWRSQIDSAAVRESRMLTGSRYDLVDRNNNIVLDYQKQELVKLSLPKLLRGTAEESVLLTAKVKSKHGFEAIEWDTASLEAAGGKVTVLSPYTLKITAPPYRFQATAAENSYTISGIARDSRGNVSKREVTRLEVQAPQARFGELTLTKNNALANNKDVNHVRARIVDGNGKLLANQSVKFSASNDAVIKVAEITTGKDGLAETDLISTKSGMTTIRLIVNNDAEKNIDASFIADASTARLAEGSVVVIQDRAIANGSALNKIQAVVTDAYNNPVPHIKVNFSSQGKIAFSAESAETDEKGNVLITLQSTHATQHAITASVNNSQQSVKATFVPDNGSAVLGADSVKVMVDGSVANNIAANKVQAVVKDAHGNVLAGQKVTFTATNGARLSASEVTTNSAGIAEVKLTTTKAGIAQVTAKIDGSERTVNTSFIADRSTARIATDGLKVVVNNAVADGKAKNELLVRVTDAYGNAIDNMAVAFSADNSAMLAATELTTDQNGEGRITLSSVKAATSQVTASVNGIKQQVKTLFIADRSTAMLVAGSLTVEVGEALANGADQNRVRVKVVDANNNPVAGVSVDFSATASAVVSPKDLSDENGNVIAMLTSTSGAESTVTAKLNGNSQQVKVLFVEMSGLITKGHTFAITEGFPTMGLIGANFQVQMNQGVAINNKFDWSSSLSQVEVSPTGVVTFASAVPKNVPIVITARLKETGKTLTYSMTLNHWVSILATADMTQIKAREICTSNGLSLISMNQATYGKAIRKVGTLWGEWGTLPHLVSNLMYVNEDNSHLHNDQGYIHVGSAAAAVCL